MGTAHQTRLNTTLLFATLALVITIIRNKCDTKIMNTLSSIAKSVPSSNNLFSVTRYVGLDVIEVSCA